MPVSTDELVAALQKLIQTEANKSAQIVLLSMLAEQYLRTHAAALASRKKIERYIRKVILPTFGHFKCNEITRRDCDMWFADLSESTGPIAANRALEVLRSMLNLGIAWGYLSSNPAAGVRKNHETKRRRYLTEEEFKRVNAALRSEGLTGHLIIVLYVLTGLRLEELRRLRWSYLNFETLTINLPQTKNGQPHTVPMSTVAAALFNRLPRGSRFVFPGRRVGTYYDIQKLWRRVKGKAGCDDVTIHDLRRTTGSWLAQLGIPLQTIATILNHQSPETTKGYAYLTERQSRESLELLAERVTTLVSLPIGSLPFHHKLPGRGVPASSEEAAAA